MKKLLTNISLIGALGLIAPSVVNNFEAIVKNLKAITNFVFNKVLVPGENNFADDALHQDAQGNYWLSSSNGLWKSTDGTNFAVVDNGLPPIVNNVPTTDYYYFQDSTGTIYVANGIADNWTIFVSKDNGGTFTAIPGIPGGLSWMSIKETKANDIVWIATSAGLYQSKDHTNFTQVTAGLPAGFKPYDVFQSSTGPTFVIDGSAVYSSSDGGTFKKDTGTNLPTIMGGNPQSWPKFYEDSIGHIYIYVNRSIYRCDQLNPTSIDSVTMIKTEAKTPAISSFFIDQNNVLWMALSNDAPDVQNLLGQIVKSTDFGATLVNAGPAIAASSIYQDNQNNIWAINSRITTDGIYVINKTTGGSTEYLKDQNGTGFYFQDRKGNIWVGTFSALWKTPSESYTGTGFNTLGKTTNIQYEGKEYILTSADVGFYANDSTVNTVIINGTTNYVYGKGFTKSLTSNENKGIFNIVVNFADGTVATFNFMIFTNNSDNMAQFLTGAGNTLQNYNSSLEGKTVKYLFVRSNGVTDPSNLEIKLGGVGYNPIIDTANSYYEQVDPFSFEVKPGTRVNLTTDTIINQNGLYLITFTDKLGNVVKYYAQLGSKNSYPFLRPVSQWNPITPSTAVADPAKKEHLLLIIISGFLGGLLFILLVSICLYVYRINAHNKKLNIEKHQTASK